MAGRRTRYVYVRQRAAPAEGETDGGGGLGKNWLKSAGLVLGVMVPLSGIATFYVQSKVTTAKQDTEKNLSELINRTRDEIRKEQQETQRRMWDQFPTKTEFVARREEMNGTLATLKATIERASGETQLELAGLRQLVREHGESLAQLRAAQELERSLHGRR